MERISGYSAEEALGRTCEILQCSRCFGKKCPAGIKKCGIIELGISEAKESFLKHKEGHNVSIIKNASVVRDEINSIIWVVETVTDMTELSKARRKIEEAALRLGEMHRLDNIIGKSHAMRDVFTAIKAAAASDVTVLVHGDSGTGNVRELENAIEHAFVACNREQIEPYDLPVELRQARYRQLNKEETSRSVSRPYRRVKIDKEELLEILNESDWNKAEAARRIGISRTAVWKYMKKWAIPLRKAS